MFSSVNGVKIIIDENISKMGWDNTLIITQGASRGHVGYSMYSYGSSTRAIQKKERPLTYTDFEILKAEVGAKHTFGMIEEWFRKTNQLNSSSHSRTDRVVVSTSSRNSWNRVRATNVDYFLSNNYPLKEGRFFNAFEMSRAEKVCIVGPNFSENDFGGKEPLNQYYTAGNNSYLIIGVLAEDQLNKSGFMNFNPWGRNWDLQAVYIPLKTGAVYLRKNMTVDYIVLQAFDADSFQEMQNRANQVLLSRRNMEKSFSFQDIGSQVLEITSQIDDMMSKWSITLLVIASISLIVGSIGLFSTLLISINERMMEIGVRKSLGAKDSDIFFYFIMEAMTLSFIASIIGIILGILLTTGLGAIIKVHVPIVMVSVYIGFGFALAIGFLSGLYPAFKAARINPIQAIYYFE